MALLKRFQRANIIASGLETIIVIFWRRMWMFLHILRLPEAKAKVKRIRLITLTKEVSKEPSLDSVVWHLDTTGRRR